MKNLLRNIASFIIPLLLYFLLFRKHILENYFNHDNVEKMLKNKLGQFYTDDNEVNFDNFVFATVLSELSELEPIERRPYNLFLFREMLKRYKDELKKREEKNYVQIVNDKFSYIKAATLSGLKKILLSKAEEINGTPYAVIDIRNNHGGSLEDMKAVAELFLPPQSIITRVHFANEKKTYINHRKKQEFQFEHVFILVDEATASTAEMFLLALKDNLDHVTVIGPPTFGKTFGMSLIELSSGHCFFYISFNWLGPSGTVELKPDVDNLAQLLPVNKFDETLLNEIISYIGSN